MTEDYTHTEENARENKWLSNKYLQFGVLLVNLFQVHALLIIAMKQVSTIRVRPLSTYVRRHNYDHSVFDTKERQI